MRLRVLEPLQSLLTLLLLVLPYGSGEADGVNGGRAAIAERL